MTKHKLGYFIAFSILVLICAPTLFSEGMFLDGLTYSAISKNMANGLGSFWVPYYTEQLFPEFYEHPPLGIGLQALFFKIFGDSIFVERIYSLGTFLITGGIMALIWKRINGSFKYGWLPILFFALIGNVAWACSNNLLENTMMIFTTLAALWIIKSRSQGIIWLILGGFSLLLAFLTKGFTSLYVWSLPFFFFLFAKEEKFGKMAVNTIVLILSTVVPLGVLFIVSNDAYTSLSEYFMKQVVGSISNVQTVDSRFSILIKFFESSIFSLIALVIVAIIGRVKKHTFDFKSNRSVALTLLAVTLSGIVPIMISLKQRPFYILTVYPLFSIAISFWFVPFIQQFKAWKISTVKTLAALTGTLAISLTVIFWGKLVRDKNLVTDVKTIITHIGRDTSVNVCMDTRLRYNVTAYFHRYGEINLLLPEYGPREFIILHKEDCRPMFEGNYEKVSLDTKDFHLYKRQ